VINYIDNISYCKDNYNYYLSSLNFLPPPRNKGPDWDWGEGGDEVTRAAQKKEALRREKQEG
jgi:hypothetical protein